MKKKILIVFSFVVGIIVIGIILHFSNFGRTQETFLPIFRTFGSATVNDPFDQYSYSSGSCTPMSGYTYCMRRKDWRDSDPDRFSEVKIHVSDIKGGIYKDGYYLGPTWRDVYIEVLGPMHDGTYAGGWIESATEVTGYNIRPGSILSNGVVRSQLSEGYNRAWIQTQYGDTRNIGKCIMYYGYNDNLPWDNVGSLALVGELGWFDCDEIKQVNCVDALDCSGEQVCDNSGDWTTWNCVDDIPVETHFITLEINVQNIDIIPLSFEIISAEPWEFLNGLDIEEILIAQPGEYVTWTTQLIDISE